MTSGNFSYLDVNQIIVNRDERQRRELTGIEELAQSIADNGLINPIVVTRDYVLVAGERRLTAHKHLGFDKIAVQFMDECDDLTLHIIELEENIRRQELPWRDETLAVANYHALQEAKAKTEGRPWSQEATAAELNMSQPTVARHLMVKQAIDEGVSEVVDAPRFSVAANFASRMQERKKATALRDLTRAIIPASSTTADTLKPEDVEQALEAAPTRRYAEIINTDFTSWSETVQEVPYNFIHCDFPYGINAGDTVGMSGAKSFGGYEDSPDVYWNLLGTFLRNQDRFVAPSAHMIFWFSMKYYTPTVEAIRAAGWRVDDFPLIWHRSDNSGILPDAQRGPRRTYETALFCTRGDRKIVRAVANSVAGVTTKTYHMSEKPVAVLEHFFRMLVDESTLLLDPTAGSGNAVKVAEALGAHWATGLELSPEYAARAKENLGLYE